MAPRGPDLGVSLLSGRLLPPSAGWVLASPSRMESLMESLSQVYLYTSQSGTKSEKVCGDSSRLAREAGGAGPRSQACWLRFRAEAAHAGGMVCTRKRKGTAHRLTAPLQLATTAAECAGSAILSQVAGGQGAAVESGGWKLSLPWHTGWHPSGQTCPRLIPSAGLLYHAGCPLCAA